jgi:phosphoribosyl 1,2-cyclic phosphodiesterase
VTISYCVLGSGSRGNCTLLAIGDGAERRVALIDCGLSVKAVRQRLNGTGFTIDDITDVLITHFDGDHCSAGWISAIATRNITVHVHTRHHNSALNAGLDGRALDVYRTGFSLSDAARVETTLLPHDALGTVGFVIESAGGARLGFATDLGHAPEGLHELFTNLHGLAIESNYDEHMQRTSARPAFLKRRVLGPRGHLSNEQSMEAVLKIAESSELSHVTPLHLSRQCNEPEIITQLYAEEAPALLDVLSMSNQDAPTGMLHVTAGDAAAPDPQPGEQSIMF